MEDFQIARDFRPKPRHHWGNNEDVDFVDVFNPVLSVFLCLPVLFFPFLDTVKLSLSSQITRPQNWLQRLFQEKFLTTGREKSSATVLDLNQQQNARSICRLHGSLWNSLHQNVLKCGQFYNLLCKGSACFYRPESGRKNVYPPCPEYWMSANCLAKLWKTAFCSRSVW